jgi:hypothetical protein
LLRSPASIILIFLLFVGAFYIEDDVSVRWKNFIMNLTTEAIRRDTSIATEMKVRWCRRKLKININISSGRFTQCTCLRIKRVASGLSCWWCPDYLGYLRPVLTVFGC